jgi:hypothetical protein
VADNRFAIQQLSLLILMLDVTERTDTKPNAVTMGFKDYSIANHLRQL